MQNKESCEQCVHNQNTNTAVIDAYLGFCDPANPTRTDTGTIELSSSTTAADVTVVLSKFVTSAGLITTYVAISTEIGGIGTVLTAQVVYPSYPGDLIITAVSTATTLADGRFIVSTIYATYTELPRPLFGVIPAATRTTITTSTTPCESESYHFRCWVFSWLLG